MRIRISISLLLFVIIGLLPVGQQVLAAEQCVSLFETLATEEVAYPPEILRNIFMTGRRLFENTRFSPSYGVGFGKRFLQKIFSLKLYQVWLDGGVGNANHFVEYYEKGGLGYGIGVGITETALHKENVKKILGGKYEHFHDRGIEEMSPSEVPPLDIVSDYFGAGTYSKYLSEVLRFYLSALRPGAPLFWMVSNSYGKLRINDENGHYISLESYLKRIPGIKVEPCRGVFKGNSFNFFEITVSKKFDPKLIPQLENTLYEFVNGESIPIREFRIIKPTIH